MFQLSILRNLFGISAMLLLISAGQAQATTAYAYVSNQKTNVSVINLATMQQVATLDVGSSGPRGIGITDDGKLLVTANQESGNLSIVDLGSGKLLRQVPVGKNPEFVRVQGYTAYISYEPSSTGGPPPKPGSPEHAEAAADKSDDLPGHIAIIDLQSGKLIADITGKPETEGIEFHRDGKQLIVTNESDNSITLHDKQSGKLLQTIELRKFGVRPRGIKSSPDGKTLLTTLEFSNKMLVLDSNYRLIKEVPTADAPYGVAFDKAGQRVYVAAGKAQLLQVFDAKNFNKIKDIKTGKRCWHFTLTPDEQHLLLACGKSDEIVVVDTVKLEVSKRIPGMSLPWGIVSYPKAMGSLDQP